MVDGASNAAELPQWLSYLAGAIGIIVSAVIVRLGWASKAEPPETTEPARIMGAIVDSGSVRELTLSIQAHAEVTKATGECVESVGHELRNLGDEIRRLANKIEK